MSIIKNHLRPRSDKMLLPNIKPALIHTWFQSLKLQAVSARPFPHHRRHRRAGTQPDHRASACRHGAGQARRPAYRAESLGSRSRRHPPRPAERPEPGAAGEELSGQPNDYPPGARRANTGCSIRCGLWNGTEIPTTTSAYFSTPTICSTLNRFLFIRKNLLPVQARFLPMTNTQIGSKIPGRSRGPLHVFIREQAASSILALDERHALDSRERIVLQAGETTSVPDPSGP